MRGTLLSERARRRVAKAEIRVVVRDLSGQTERVGSGPVTIEVEVRSERGREAVNSLSELRVVEAYLDGEIDVSGDLIAAMDLRKAMTDIQPLIRAGTVLAPLVRDAGG